MKQQHFSPDETPLVLPWDMVDNSASPCELISGWFFPHSTVQVGYFIL
jgi:hypothetical protein